MCEFGQGVDSTLGGDAQAHLGHLRPRGASGWLGELGEGVIPLCERDHYGSEGEWGWLPDGKNERRENGDSPLPPAGFFGVSVVGEPVGDTGVVIGGCSQKGAEVLCAPVSDQPL